jgi:hypothetical protein
MCDLIIDHETAKAYVEQAQKMALESFEPWTDALHSLSAYQENEVVLALKGGDFCRAGELLDMYLRQTVEDTAKDIAQDELATRYGKEIAA